MREILFRGKTESGCWTRGSLSLYSEPGKVEIQYPVYFEDEEGNIDPSFDYQEVVPETVGQFTGLYDKNGKRIFEGDVVRIKGYRPIINGDYEVVYDEEGYHGWCFQRDPARHLRAFFSFSNLNYFWEMSEVIGNVHDNPELLKG